MKTKSIYFRIKLAGRGIVNYDSNDQIYLLNKLGFNHLTPMNKGKFNENVNYAKKRFSVEPDGSASYKLAISPFCLGKAIYKNEIEITTTTVGTKDELFIPYIASPASLMRGFMQTNGKNTQTWIRKSPVSLPEAIQTNNAISALEINTKAGGRTDDSLFYKEVVGDIEYATLGAINLQELQFCSVDPIHGRAMFNEDLYSVFKKTLQYHIPKFDSELGFYCGKNSVVKIPERGFLLSSDVVVDLVQFYFERLLSLKVTRSKSFAEVVGLEYKLVSNPLEDLSGDSSGWNTISSLEDVKNINFDVEDFYQQFDEEAAKELRGELDSLVENKKNVKAEEKAKLKADKDDKKNKK